MKSESELRRNRQDLKELLDSLVWFLIALFGVMGAIALMVYLF